MTPSTLALINQFLPLVLHLVILLVIPFLAHLAHDALLAGQVYVAHHLQEQDRTRVGDAVKLGVRVAEELGRSPGAALSSQHKLDTALHTATTYLQHYGLTLDLAELTSYVQAEVYQQFHQYEYTAPVAEEAPAAAAPQVSVTPPTDHVEGGAGI